MAFLKKLPLVMVVTFPLLASAQGTQGQQRGPGGGEMMRHRPPSSLELLLENRETLGLTPEQVGKVTELQAALEEKNAPVIEKLEALRPPRPPPPGSGASAGTPPDASKMEAIHKQVEPLMQEVRANDDAAYAQAEAVLSDAQKTKARELVTQAREQERARHEAMRQRMMRGGQ